MSQRKTKERIDRWVGDGSLSHAGQPLGVVRYVVDVYQEFFYLSGLGDALGVEEKVAGLQDLMVSLSGHHIDAFKFIGETLTLHMKDGRRLDGFLEGRRFVAGGQVEGP